MTTFTVDPKDYPTPLELAEAGYKGYAEKTGGKTFDGRDMPEWKDLPERTMRAWVAAVVAIQTETARGTVYLPVQIPGAASVSQVHSFTVTTKDGVLVHNGTDCWCGGVVSHNAQVGAVHQLTQDGD